MIPVRLPDVGFHIIDLGFKLVVSADQCVKIENYTAKVGQDNVNIGVVTIFRLANTSLLQVY